MKRLLLLAIAITTLSVIGVNAVDGTWTKLKADGTTRYKIWSRLASRTFHNQTISKWTRSDVMAFNKTYPDSVLAQQYFDKKYPTSMAYVVTYADKDASAVNVLCGTCGGNAACQACKFE